MTGGIQVVIIWFLEVMWLAGHHLKKEWLLVHQQRLSIYRALTNGSVDVMSILVLLGEMGFILSGKSKLLCYN